MKTTKLLIAALGCLISLGFYAQTTNIEWEQFDGVKPTTFNGLEETYATGGWEYGSASSRQRLCGNTDGFIQMETFLGNLIVGLSLENSGSSFFDVDFGIYLNGTTLGIYEYGELITSTSVLRTPTEFVRVERLAGVVTYTFDNGFAPFAYTSTNTVNQTLVADIILEAFGDEVRNCVCNFSAENCVEVQDHDWYDEANAGIAPDDIADDIYTEGNVRIDGGDLLVQGNGRVEGNIEGEQGYLWIEGPSGSNPTSGSGTRFMWIPDQAALRAGMISSGGTEWDPGSIGHGSMAGGWNNLASGLASFAMGTGNDALGQKAVALGALSVASNDLSMAIGEACNSSGFAAITMGSNSASSGDHSIAMGVQADATEEKAIAIGTHVESSGLESIVLGSGVHNFAKLNNDIDNTMMVGFESEKPTLFVGESVASDMWGKVGVGETDPDGFLHVKFPFACGQFHSGAWNAVFQADSGAWSNILAKCGFFPSGLGNGESPGCMEDGWNSAFHVISRDVVNDTTSEIARIFANHCAQFATVFTASDANYKSNVRAIENPMDILSELEGKAYDFKFSPHATPMPSMGFIAQDVEALIPELTHTDENGLKSVNYDGFIPILTEAIKEQQEEINGKDEKIAALEEQLVAVQDALDEMQSDLQTICTDGCNRIMNADQAPDLGSTSLDGARLDQNNPNPTNEGTTISYYLPETVANATLFVYDLNGRQLAKYALGQTGEASFNIQPGEFAAGTYLYSLIADGVVVGSKRMIIMD